MGTAVAYFATAILFLWRVTVTRRVVVTGLGAVTPVGNTVELTVTPSNGPATTVVSGALTGSEDNATASVSVDLPDGPSVLSAEVSFTVTVAMQEQLAPFANGEQIAQVTLSVDPERGPLTTLITAAGEEFVWPSRVAAWN